MLVITKIQGTAIISSLALDGLFGLADLKFTS